MRGPRFSMYGTPRWLIQINTQLSYFLFDCKAVLAVPHDAMASVPGEQGSSFFSLQVASSAHASLTT